MSTTADHKLTKLQVADLNTYWNFEYRFFYDPAENPLLHTHTHTLTYKHTYIHTHTHTPPHDAALCYVT